MKWYRSYLADLETTIACADIRGRSFVYDPGHCEPYFAESTYGYWGLFEKVTENFCLLEWDIALSLEDRKLFEKYCAAEPDIIHVAPYKHYGYRNIYTDFGWMHRYSKMSFVREGDPYCFYFGFGLIYFPVTIVKQYLRAAENYDKIFIDNGAECELYPGAMRHGETFDCIFSAWHATVTDMQPVPIHWDVRPTHLNYDVRPAFDATRDQIAAQEEMRRQLDTSELSSSMEGRYSAVASWG